MNKINKNVLIIILSLIVMVQIFFINKFNREKNVVVYNNVNKTVNHKSLKDINEELNCLNNKEILSASKINNVWCVKIKIQGNKEELVSEIAKLKNYEISDYAINRNDDENSIVLDICSKDNV